MDDEDFVAALASAQQWAENYADAQDIPDDEIPESFDLTDIGGFDFTTPVRDQGGCGSCYTVSVIQVYESRLKMKYGEEPPLLSPQYMMTCNYLTEGCDGGWAFFHGLLAENGGLVSEECSPYEGKTAGITCGDYADCAPQAKVTESYFIGGAYGESTELKMMKEILRNGMVNGEFLAPGTFGMYSEGIL